MPHAKMSDDYVRKLIDTQSFNVGTGGLLDNLTEEINAIADINNETSKRRNVRCQWFILSRALSRPLDPPSDVSVDSQRLAQWLVGGCPEPTRVEDIKVPQLSGIGNGILVCRKCKSRHTEFTQVQTRGADEPMTVFASCNKCGFRWRDG